MRRILIGLTLAITAYAQVGGRGGLGGTTRPGVGGTASLVTPGQVTCVSAAGIIGECNAAASPSITKAIGATSTDGLVLANTTPATVGAQKWSPRLHFSGRGWKTDATAASQAVDWIAEVVPVEGAAAPSARLDFSYSINGGAYTPVFTCRNENCGFGTTSPANDLDIGSLADNNTTRTLRFTNSAFGLKVVGGGTTGAQIIQAIGGTGYLDFQSGNLNDQKYVFSGTGNVGIGTAAPLLKLDVAGSGRFTGAATSVLTGSIDAIASTTVTGVGTLFTTELVVGDRITITGETRTVTAIATNTSLTVDTATTDTLNDTTPDKLAAIFITRLSSNAIGMVQNDLGNVGIGTMVPTTLLSLSSSAPTLTLANTQTTLGVGTASAISFVNSDASTNGSGEKAYIRGLSTDSAGQQMELAFGVGNNLTPLLEAMRINSTGNVGIGTTGPGAKLEVFGATDKRLYLQPNPTTNSQPIIAARTAAVGDYLGFAVRRSSDPAALTDGAGADVRMVITDTGNVGIGTTGPGTKLEVLGGTMTGIANAQANAAGFFRGPGTVGLAIGHENGGNRPALQVVNAGSAMDLLIQPYGGNVGIGTTGPATLLHLSNSVAGASEQLRVENRNDGATATADIGFRVGSTVNNKAFISSSYSTAFYLALGAGNPASEVVRITNGNIGIGTVAPDRLLHAELADAGTTTVSNIARLTHISSGTPAAGFGAGLEFELETATASTNALAASIEAAWTTATAGVEDGYLDFKTMTAGTLSAKWRITKDGHLTGIATVDVIVPKIKSTTGQRYVCIDTNGVLVSSVSACVGT